MDKVQEILCNELKIDIKQVKSVIELLDEGNTIPFIARYRKEITGGLSDDVLRKFYERLNYLRNLETRKEDVIRLIDEQGKLSYEIKNAIINSKTLTEIEDIYRPFKLKKRTRATMAKEKGLDTLAELIYLGNFNGNLEEEANKFLNEDKNVNSLEDAFNGAMDIISEKISDNADYRKWIRSFVLSNGIIETKSDVKERTPYEMYYDYKESVNCIPPHRILAINRGEKEKILSVKIIIPEDKVINYLLNQNLKGNKITDSYIEISVKDSFKRLIFPSIEREIRSTLTDKGEESAIKIFKENLKSLLMQAPIKGKRVMGFDPGFRTGCKIAILDDTGKFLEKSVVYLFEGKKENNSIVKQLKDLIYKYEIDIISLGNGTASRESEEIISKVLKEIKEESNKDIYYVIVSEAGASVYSASELAAKEYPNLDVTIRGAISIGRRLQDPLVELVKIDPKSIGVGQYQHDVTVKKLDESLTGVVEDCVNNVGVDLNIATPTLLTYISGISKSIAENIVIYREENGKFKNRKELLKVKRLGPKVFEQCAGFLRVLESDETLDNTSVHPESYKATKALIKRLGFNIQNLKIENLNIDEEIKKIGINNLAKDLEIGVPTLSDIVNELKKPGRDIREELPTPILKTGVMDIKDLKEGMILMGTVRNVSDFGAFVDIGVHQDGLVHKSQMSDSFVRHPLDIVKVGDIVEVKILSIDDNLKRISLSMKK